MADVLEVKIVRPYDSLDDYVQGDAWTVERTGLVLVNQNDLEPKTRVRFEIAIESGEPVVSGEGRVVASVEPEGNRPGGARIQFRKLDSKSKRVLKRALDHQRTSGEEHEPDEDVDRVETTTEDGELPQQPAGEVETPEAAASGPAPAQKSGVRHKATEPVAAPENRDSLLDRLRERARRASETDSADLDRAAEG